MKLKKIFLLLSALMFVPAFVASVYAEEAAAEEQEVIVVYNGTFTIVSNSVGDVVAVLGGNPLNLPAQNTAFASTAVITQAVVAPAGNVVTPPVVRVAPVAPAATPVVSPAATAAVAAAAVITSPATIPATVVAGPTSTVVVTPTPAAPAPQPPAPAPAPVPVADQTVPGSPNRPIGG